MLLNTKCPLVLRFQLNEQQKIKSMGVSGNDVYGKRWACDSADSYSAFGEISLFWFSVKIAYYFKLWTAWTVRLEAVNCSEIDKSRSARNDTRIEFKV